jgi:hypothetical protein
MTGSKITTSTLEVIGATGPTGGISGSGSGCGGGGVGVWLDPNRELNKSRIASRMVRGELLI